MKDYQQGRGSQIKFGGSSPVENKFIIIVLFLSFSSFSGFLVLSYVFLLTFSAYPSLFCSQIIIIIINSSELKKHQIGGFLLRWSEKEFYVFSYMVNYLLVFVCFCNLNFLIKRFTISFKSNYLYY